VHYRVVKRGDGDTVTSAVSELDRSARIDELARMLGGSEVTAKARANAKDLAEQGRRRAGPPDR
jgi:DNA repair protein RecN (Recombination protein N)